MEIKIWNDCYVHLEDTILRIGNERIERSWSFANGYPVNLSLLDKKNGSEWLHASASSKMPMFQLSSLSDSDHIHSVYVSSQIDNDFGVAEPYLQTDIDMLDVLSNPILRLTIKISPNAAFIRQEISAGYNEMTVSHKKNEQENMRYVIWTADNQKEKSFISENQLQLDDNNKQKNRSKLDYCDRFALRDLHCRWEAVQFLDQTDTNNNLVHHDQGLLYVNENRSIPGNLLFLNKTLQPSGLLLIKEGPTSLSEFGSDGLNFRFHGMSVSIEGTGITDTDLLTGERIASYGTTIGVYDGTSMGGKSLIYDYHRSIRAFHPKRDSFLMSNTWGDRSKDGAISESFLIKELHKAAELGLTIMQIDDGWQKGVTQNSLHAATQAHGGLWSDYYSGEGDFWEVHPVRFPNGLTPIVTLARELNIGIGLWFSLDSVHDYVNWEKDIATLLHLHSTYQIIAFKLDGIELRSKLGETRLLNIMRQVTYATQGKVDFNIDATAQKRQGYFDQTQYGSIFLENRYTDWRNYYPHWTLRNLWTLAPYIPTSRLQMEFLNVNRNKANYEGDPLAPAAVGQVYAFAAVAFTNPLAWMELSALDADQITGLSSIIYGLKPYHSDILAGQVLPVGDEPSGVSWTGFQSITSPTSGYLLILRELHADDSAFIKLWGVDQRMKLTAILRMDEKDQVVISDSHEQLALEPDERGAFVFSRPAPFTFAIYKYEM
ncbi:alpha-galactosidase [Paenibacillus sp. strain BS8-2]